MDKMIEHFEKIRSCTDSCKNTLELEAINNMIDNFKKRWMQEPVYYQVIAFALVLEKQRVQRETALRD